MTKPEICKAILNDLAQYASPSRKEKVATNHPKTVSKVFESPYNGKIEIFVELFTWEKLDYVDRIKSAFGIS